MRSIVLVSFAVAFLVAVKAVNVITVTNCDPHTGCTQGCQSQEFNQGECLQESGTGLTVQLSCPKSPAVCIEVDYYSDAQCQNQQDTLNAVCGNCDGPSVGGNNFMVVCGALRSAVFYVYNCTDDTCGTCNNNKVVPFNKCENVNGLNFIIRPARDCKPVVLNQYNSTNCGGNLTSFQYPDGLCVAGTTFSCASSSTPAPEGAESKAAYRLAASSPKRVYLQGIRPKP